MAPGRLGITASLVKYLVLVINVVSMFAGVLLIIVGSYISNADQTVTGIASNSLPIGLLSLGVFISAISFIGCIGAQKEWGGVLKIYFFLLSLLVFFQICVGIAALIKQNEVDALVDSQWSTVYVQDPGLIQDVEKIFSCCGFSNVTDRAVPSNCAAVTQAIVPCKSVVEASIQSNLKTIGVTGVVMGAFEVVGLLFSFVLFKRIRKMHRESRDAALLEEAKRLERDGQLRV